MKQFVALFILFCLTFLNVPRDWVHDCVHESGAHLNDESSVHIENEECFVCEFDLDVYTVLIEFEPQVKAPISSEIEINLIAEELVDKQDGLYLRGPPKV